MGHRALMMCLGSAVVIAWLSGAAWADPPVGAATADSQVVYRSDFREGADGAWSARMVDRPEEGPAVLGRFANQMVSVELGDYPAGQLMRVSVRLQTIGNWRGVAGGRWWVRAAGGPTLLDTTFAAGGGGDSEAWQAYPAWIGEGRNDPGRGAKATKRWVWRGTGGDRQSSDVYELSFVFAHGGGPVSLWFAGEGLGEGAWWALEQVQVARVGIGQAMGREAMAKLCEGGAVRLEDRGETVDALVVQGGAAVAYLVERMTQGADTRKLEELIVKLDDADFDVREAATAALIRMGGIIEKPLRDVLSRSPSPEVRFRIETVLEEVGEPVLTESDQAVHRSGVEVLARLAGREGKDALAEVAERSPYAFTRGRATMALRDLAVSVEQARLYAADRALLAGRGEEVERVLGAFEGGGEQEAVRLLRERLAERVKAEGRVGELSGQLKGGQGGDEVRRELARLLVIELNQPKRAAALMNPVPVEGFERYREALVGDELSGELLFELAQWHRGLANESASLGKLQMLVACQRRLEAYLSQESVARRGEALKLYREVTETVGELRSTGLGWTDLLSLVEIGEALKGGGWSRTSAGVTLEAGSFRTLSIPVMPEGSYELRVRFRRLEGNDGIFIAIPAGGAMANLNISGWQGAVSGLEWIDSQEANSNPSTVKPAGIANEQAYELNCRVVVSDGQLDFATTLNGQPYVKWQGRLEQLSKASAWDLKHDRCFAIGAHMSKMVFESVRVRALSGEIRRLDQAEGADP